MIRTITFRINDQNDADRHIFELRENAKAKGISFSDVVKRALRGFDELDADMESKIIKIEGKVRDMEKDLDHAQDEIRKMQNWLWQNGMPD
mgnify:CR=1 FL=1